MPHGYAAFGLRIHADGPIPGLVETPGPGVPDLSIELQSAAAAWPDPADEELYYRATDAAGETLRIGRDARRGSFRFVYGDGSEFLIEDSATRVRARWRDAVGVEGMAVYLLGPVIGLVLRLRGTTCLHASAVSTGTHALAVMAAAGHGKSTTAAAFARRGYAVLTDDLLALRENEADFLVEPAYPRLRLWPHAVAGIFGSPEALPRIAPRDPHWDKRFIDLGEEPFRFCDRAVPLAAVYVGAQDDNVPFPQVEKLGGREAMLTLLAHAYGRDMPGAAMRARDFERFARLIEGVPVRRFRMAEGFGQLDALCEVLADDCSRAAAPR